MSTSNHASKYCLNLMAAVLVYDVGPWEAEQENLTDLIFLQVEGNLSKC